MKQQDVCGAVDPLQGGVTLELNENMVLHAKKGKLYVCKCKNFTLDCKKVGSNTYCSQKCIFWVCDEISANKIVNKAIINELSME